MVVTGLLLLSSSQFVLGGSQPLGAPMILNSRVYVGSRAMTSSNAGKTGWQHWRGTAKAENCSRVNSLGCNGLRFDCWRNMRLAKLTLEAWRQRERG